MWCHFKKGKTFDFICSFNDSFRTAIKNASKFLLVLLSFGVCIKISHANKWLMLLDKYLAGLLTGCYVYSNVFLHFFFVSLTDSFPHKHLPLYIRVEGYKFLVLNFKCEFYLSCQPFNCNSIMVIGKCQIS